MIAEQLASTIGWLGIDEWRAVLLSLQVASVAVASSIPIGLLVAYALARWRFPGRSILNILVHLPLVMPPVVTGYLLLLAFGRNGPLGQLLEDTFGFRFAFEWTGAALASAIMGFPLMVRAMQLGFEAVDGRLEEAAQTLGSTRWQVWLRISAPLALPGIVAGMVLAFAKAMGEFGATITFVSNIPGQTQTIPTAIYAFLQVPGGEASVFRLMAVSVGISILALMISEWMARSSPSPWKTD